MAQRKSRRRKARRPGGSGRPAPTGANRPARKPVKKGTPEVTLPAPLTARDGIGALVVTVLAAALFATTFSSHVATGDAPESVAGVRSLGILHAPGYPSYVLAGRLFGTLVAV